MATKRKGEKARQHIHRAWPQFKEEHCPFIHRVPASYEPSGSGLAIIDKGYLTDTPVVITERRRHVGKDLTTFKISVLDHGRAEIYVVEAGMLFDTKKIMGLLNFGIQLTSETSKDLARYFRAYETENDIPTVKLVEHLGLYGSPPLWGYLLDKPHGLLTDVRFDSIQEDLKIRHEAMIPKGDYLKWLEAFKLVAGMPKVIFTILCSLYPLVRTVYSLSVPNFTLHLWGGSGTGKTVTQQVALSLLADPLATAWIPVWGGTANGVEALALLTQGLPLFLQDSQESDPEVHTAVLYRAGNGIWKARGGKRQRIQSTWNGVLISTGESPIVQVTSTTGAAQRCIQLYGPPFGFEGDLLKHFVADIMPSLRQNYGHAFPKVLDFLLSRSLKHGANDRTRYQELSGKYISRSSGHPLAQRQAGVFAALHLLAEFLPEALNAEFPKSPVAAVEAVWEEVLKTENPNRPERVFETIKSWAFSNSAYLIKRPTFRDQDDVVHGTALGVYNSQERTLAIFPDRLDRFLQERKYPPVEALAPDWKHLGLLKHNEGRHTLQVRVEGQRVRMVAFLLPERGDDEGSETI